MITGIVPKGEIVYEGYTITEKGKKVAAILVHVNVPIDEVLYKIHENKNPQ